MVRRLLWAVPPSIHLGRPPLPIRKVRDMTKLIYVTNMSLDGYIEDEHGSINFFPVDAEVFRSHTDLLQSAGTFLYGRRLYEIMAVWETDATLAARSDAHGRVRDRLAGSGQGRLLHDADRRVDRQDPDRTPPRPHRSARAEGFGQQRHHRRRCEPRVPGTRGRAGRRVPAVRPAHCPRSGESRPCRPTRASTSSSSMNAGSGTVSYSSGTALWASRLTAKTRTCSSTSRTVCP